MFEQTDYDRIAHAEVVTRDGESLGTADALYVDDTSDTPTWVTVHSGLLGLRTHFVPLRDATLEGDRLVVPYTRDEITGAPSMGEDGHLTPDDEAELFRHYGRGDFEATGDPRMRRYAEGTDADRVPHYVESAQAGTAAAAGAAYVDARRDPEDPDLDLDARRGGVFDRDADGRGPVEEVLDGPDALHDRDRDRGFAERDRNLDVTGDNSDLSGRGGVFDRDGDGRGPIGEVLDGPDGPKDDFGRGYAGDTGRTEGARGDVWAAIDDLGRKLDDVLRRLDGR